MTDILLVDPGHGGADPGAVASGFSLREKDLTLAISKHIQQYLKDNYVSDVRLTRDTDKTMSLKERTDMANRIGARYFASIHINAGGGTGYEDFIHTNLNDSSVTAKMRDIVHAEIVKVLEKYEVRNRGKKKANFHVLRETNMSAVLTETMFIDNSNDQKLLANDAFVRDMAYAHAIGIARAIGYTKKATPTVTTSTTTAKSTSEVGMHRVIADGKQVGAWSSQSYLLRAVEKAVASGAKEVKIQTV